ncbi:hypothetical protein CDD83_4839 [Cordyceps sp. RAO-2017]|nr:hypothetical protein CDD83_4839 [Cordyceps sp. RAO-2017]
MKTYSSHLTFSPPLDAAAWLADSRTSSQPAHPLSPAPPLLPLASVPDALLALPPPDDEPAFATLPLADAFDPVPTADHFHAFDFAQAFVHQQQQQQQHQQHPHQHPHPHPHQHQQPPPPQPQPPLQQQPPPQPRQPPQQPPPPPQQPPQQQHNHNHNHSQPYAASPTTPPTSSSAVPFGHQRQQPQPPSQHQHQLPAPGNATANGRISAPPAAPANGFDDMPAMQRGSDEDDFLTPAQSRRKAQNRAAQRAFRERKEKHVKDLEAKLASLEAAQQKTSVENERLKRDLQKMSTENEILRATSAITNGNHSSLSPEPPSVGGPLQYNRTDFYSNVLQNYQNKLPSHRVITSDDGERLLAAGATWDFIISHDLYKRGLVDVGDVSERLKKLARCDGQGPVFSESIIINAIEQSVASGSDDLL